MYAGWHAEASGNDADCGQPHDAFAISFSEDIFRPISGTEDNGFYSPNHATDESLTNTDFRHHGYKGEWNDKKLTSNWKGYLEVDIEERDSTADTATLYSDWIHTYTSYCVPSGMGVGFDFPGAGTLTINSQDVSVVKWRLEDNLSHSIV